ncbi:Lysosomal beta glucosidase [Smittium mucronatum]|uniref:beta-glucosidase n=1 Tax=Smittium mucronatum TaxID=133383 RepID=A0A1R0GL26_9FUNG|nr:Lysosomal beta glucosidase [Smittium mucronatum]
MSRNYSILYLLTSLLAFPLSGAQPSLLSAANFKKPEIEVVGPRTQGGVVCLPDYFPLQDFDPMRPKSVVSYNLTQYDESVTVGPSDTFDSDVLELVQSLTLAEKVGQMTQTHVLFYVGCDGNLNVTAIEAAFRDQKIGFLFGGVSDFMGRFAFLSPQRFANITNTIQQIAISVGSKIPYMQGSDSIHGANFVKGATMFPAPVNAAATFNPIHAFNNGRIGSKDSRSAGIHWAYAPQADLNTQKLWSRNFENFGEDPYLSSVMIEHAVKGFQGNYKLDRARVAATFKHFIGYTTPINGKDQEPRYIPMNHLLEYHVPSFKSAIDAGAATGMEAYGALNGQDTISSSLLLTTLLRDKLGFKGLMTSDNREIFAQFNQHFTAFSYLDATFQTFNNTSIDVSMNFDVNNTVSTLIELVETGKVPMDRLDLSVSRILQLKKDLGLFENPFSDPSLIDTVGSPQDVELSRNSARESLILLKNNDNVLPLSPKEKILYVGANFNSTRYITGAWNVHFDGPSDLEGDAVYDGHSDTILLGIQSITGTAPNWIPGYSIDGIASTGYETIVREARKADKVVFFFGEVPATESFGNIDTLRMAHDQYDIVNKVYEHTKTPIILVLAQNHPYSLGELSSAADAIINANLPGAYGGLPVAEILFGKISPSGRQPYTYPKLDYQAAVTYYTPIWNEYDPEFAFGQGMGYNNITYSNITVSAFELGLNSSPITVTVTATNNGQLDQLEPVLMYTTQKIRRGYSPEHYRLRAFDKKLITPGSSETFSFNLTAQEMQFYDIDSNLVYEVGPVDITINAFNENSVVASITLV